jgi:WD40 repeat protein
MKKHTILFLAANPSGTDRRALDREARSIWTELKGCGHRERFQLETRWAAESLDLLRALRELRPAVVHFSGHGGRDGVVFQAADGGAQVVPTEAIAEAFGAAGASVKLAVLSACYSDAQAEALLAHVDCVVGMSGAIRDDAARSFAIGFYGGLGEHEPVAAAYKQGCAAMNLEGLREGERPQLRVRAGVDADRLVLAAIAPEERLELPCPYPGMRPYTVDDAAHFYGRDKEVKELLGRLRAGEREIYVIGPSGSGKSSLVAAGLLPRLARGSPGLGPFLVRSMRPGEHPSVQLSDALEAKVEEPVSAASAAAALLAPLAPGTSILLVVDQLEELFALPSSDERAQFQAALQSLQAEPRCAVICALRADFFGAFMESPLWTDRRGQISRIEVSPLRGETLRAAIVRPARKLGVHIEPELIERLLADAGAEPGILPLLQETLVQLWDQRQAQLLTLADYQALGDGGQSGLAIALSRRADATLRTLTLAQEAIARRILLRLVSFGEGRSDTRRQQPRSKLRTTEDDAADFDAVLRRLVADRLLTTDDDHEGEARVDLAHEVMITAWSTLAGWIQTRRADEQHRRHLEAAAVQWVRRGRGPGGLLDRAELAEVEVWRRTAIARELGADSEVAELIAASKQAHDQQRRRARVLVASVFIVLIATTVGVARLALMAHHEARKAEASRKQSARLLAQSYQETGRQILLEGHPCEAIPYLVAALEKGETGSALRGLFWTAARTLPLTPPLEHQGAVLHAAFIRGDTHIVTVSDDEQRTTSRLGVLSDDVSLLFPRGVNKIARVWDATTGKLLDPQLERWRNVSTAVLSPDGARVVTVIGGAAQIWDRATDELVAAPFGYGEPVKSVAFNFDSTRIVTVSETGTACVWDAATGTPLAPPLEHPGAVTSAAFSPDGLRIVTVGDDGAAHTWNALTGMRVVLPLEHPGAVTSAAFSLDRTRVVTMSDDGIARTWDAGTGTLLATFFEHRGAVASAAFSPDGDRIVTAGADSTARVWDAATGKLLTPPFEHQGAVASAAFSPDGNRVVTASADGAARVWDVVTGKLLRRPLEHRGPVTRAVFSSDGTRLITTASDHSVRIWDVTPDKRLQYRGTVTHIALSPNEVRVVTASNDHTVRVWDVATGKPLTMPLTHRGAVNSVAFAPDGARIVTASDDHSARIWDAATGEPLARPLTHPLVVWSAAFSPDGTSVVTAGADQTARVWDATTGELRTIITVSTTPIASFWQAVTGKPLPPLPVPSEPEDAVRSAAFSPDGTSVITASWNNTTQIWDAATGRPLTRSLKHKWSVRDAAFSRDGARVITASEDSTARVWDASTGKLITTLREHRGAVRSVAFSPDGTRVVTANHHTAHVWDATTGKLLATFEHRAPVRSAAFSSDGTSVVTASADHTARIWEIRLDQRELAAWIEVSRQCPFELTADRVLLPRDPGGD